jgi:hypothetical protein
VYILSSDLLIDRGFSIKAISADLMRIIVMIMNIIKVFLFLKTSSILEKSDHPVMMMKRRIYFALRRMVQFTFNLLTLMLTSHVKNAEKLPTSLQQLL